MSIYSNQSTYGGSTYGGGSSQYPPQAQPTHRSQRSGQIYGGSAPTIREQRSSAYSGYAQGPPPGADPQLWEWFSTVDADRSGSIDANELQAALVNGERSILMLYL